MNTEASAELLALAWQELLDKSDRTSPPEYPDMALITFDELCGIVTRSHLSVEVGEEGVEAMIVDLFGVEDPEWNSRCHINRSFSDTRSLFKSALTAAIPYLSPVRPEVGEPGWKLVPVDPTKAMVDECHKLVSFADEYTTQDYEDAPKLAWQAMLSAAPVRPAWKPDTLDMQQIRDWINSGELSFSVPGGAIKSLWQSVSREFGMPPAERKP